MTTIDTSIQSESKKLLTFFEVFEAELNELFGLLQRYSEEELNHRPNVKTWSAMQIVQHLMLAERSSFLQIKKKLATNREQYKKASKTSKLRAIVLATSLKQPIKLPAPAIHTKDIVDFLTLAAAQQQWLLHRNELYHFLAALSEEDLEREVFKHPVIGIMDVWGMLDYFEAHFLRHAKQINKILWKSVLQK
jgi:uncharacterized damage-inducible protein DinB